MFNNNNNRQRGENKFGNLNFNGPRDNNNHRSHGGLNGGRGDIGRGLRESKNQTGNGLSNNNNQMGQGLNGGFNENNRNHMRGNNHMNGNRLNGGKSDIGGGLRGSNNQNGNGLGNNNQMGKGLNGGFNGDNRNHRSNNQMSMGGKQKVGFSNNKRHGRMGNKISHGGFNYGNRRKKQCIYCGHPSLSDIDQERADIDIEEIINIILEEDDDYNNTLNKNKSQSNENRTFGWERIDDIIDEVEKNNKFEVDKTKEENNSKKIKIKISIEVEYPEEETNIDSKDGTKKRKEKRITKGDWLDLINEIEKDMDN